MKKILPLIHLLFCVSSFGQVYPVQVTPQIAPPYSPYLSDYTAPGAQNFMVHIRANDVTLSEYRCKLRLTIEGVGITIRTKPGLITPPIILEGGGTSHVYYGSDLLPYFHPDALDFSGISKSQYMKTARLPEGVYRFSIEVLDYNRGTVVSNKGIAMAWIVLNDPPILNTPANFSKVQIQDPLNILFSWTPRHSASPNAAFSTEYKFRMIELWPDDRNPYDAFLSQPPLYETATTQNQLLFGINETPLTPGRKYAWQVQARDTDGRDLFRNDGRSEVHVFQYGEALDIPKNLHMRWAKPTTLAMKWNAVKVPNQDVKYRLQWRPRRRSEDQQWYETRTKFTDKTLYHLAPSTEYEMKVRTETPLQESDYSEIQIFKTLPPDEQAFVCKTDIAPPPLPANSDPVFPLSVNDTIHAGGYDILVRDVMKVDNKYFGSGVAIVPWFNSAKVRVTFENIGVNDRFWLKSGTIKSVWNTDGDFLFEEQVVPLPGAAPQAGALDITVVATDSLITVSGTVIVTVDLDPAGNIVVTTTDGKEQTLSGGESYAIVDEMANGYVVDEQGNIAKTTATQATATATRGDRTYDLVFRFLKGEGRFGFDEKKYEALAHYYQIFGDGTFASWKAISSGTGDMIIGQLSSTDVKPDDVTFEVGGAHLTPASREGNNITLTVQGMHGGIEEELLALHRISDTIPAKVLGKVNLVTYNPLRYQLQIVPVNDASAPGGLDVGEIARRLNQIYDQAVVEWDVSMSDVLTVPLDETFDEGEAGVLSNYTADMKKVLGAFGRLQNNTYYLFLIESPTNASTLGYMPRNRRAGFVFTGPHHGDADEFIKTLAHELGHGAFNLKHTFSEHHLPAGMTDNVMDYSDGTALYKYQWDYIHDPQAVMGLFEEDEEGEMSAAFVAFQQEFNEKIGGVKGKDECFSVGVKRGFEVSDRFDFDVALYAGFLRFLLCQTEIEKCAQDGALSPYGCGLSNGLLQELDWITMLETIEGWSVDPEEILMCMVNSYPIGGNPDDDLTFANVAFKCLVGVEIKDLANSIKDFVSANWDEPYYQGQATAFALTLFSPVKTQVLTKLRHLPQYAGKLTDLKLLAKASNTDELIDISKNLAKDKFSTSSKTNARNNLSLVDDGEEIFAGARKNAVARFGKEAEHLIYVKFNKNGGAAAEILDHYGEDGLIALKKVNNIQDAAKELVRNRILYRYINEESFNFNELKLEGLITAAPAKYPTYVTLDLLEDGMAAVDKLQLPGGKKPTWVAEFSGNEIINDIQFPRAKWTRADYLEVLCRSYPKNGKGGGGQFITFLPIHVRKLRNLETGEVITFNH